MLRFMRRFLAGFTACIVLFATQGNVFAADKLVMPRDLIDFALANACSPIDNFFDRPGLINPPYVYGWLPGDPERSAVFWCKNTSGGGKPYSLKFKLVAPKESAGCPTSIEWSDQPGGLSIEMRAHLDLIDFHYVTRPKQMGPSRVVANAKVLVSYYDGLSDVFFCYEGRWLFATSE
ncbi:MAG: hypothetical protein ABJA69_02805 [Acidobacteriaceae bacterium]